MRKGIKYGLLLSGWIITGVLLVVVLALLLIQTPPAKRVMAEQAGKLLSQKIGGELSIKKIDGNFYSHLTVKNILLTLNDDTLADIDAIQARYNLRTLLRKEITLHALEIIHPRFFIKQEKDSSWNIRQIISSGTENPDQEEEAAGSFSFRLPVFRIENGFIGIAAIDSVIPRRIENLNTELSILWTEKEKQASLHQCSLSTREPDFHLKRLNFSLLQNNHCIELQDFNLKTAMNRLSGEFSYAPEQGDGHAHFEIPKLVLQEFSAFIPNLKFQATPRINLNAGIEENAVQATFHIEDQKQKITVQIASENLADMLFQSGDSVLKYALTGKFDRVEPGRWLGKEEIPYTLNGTIKASGCGLNPVSAQAAVSGRFNNWTLADRQTGSIHFDLKIDQGNLTGILEGDGKFGSFRLQPSVKNLSGVPSYRARLTTKNLDLKGLTGIDELNSSLNITADISGTEFDPDGMKASFLLNTLNSRFQEITIDTLITGAHFQKNNLMVERLRVKTRTAVLTASGNYSLGGRSDLQLFASFQGLEEFHGYLPDTSLETSGFLRAGMFGSPGAYTVNTTVELDSARYGKSTLAQIRLDATGHLTAEDTILQAGLKAKKIKSGNLLIDSVDTRIAGSLDSLFLAANLDMQDFSSHLETGIVPGNMLRLHLSDWQIDFNDQKWALQDPPAIVEADASNYQISHFKLISDQEEDEQFIAMEGKISRKAEQDFNLTIRNFNLKDLMAPAAPDDSIAGRFHTQIDLTGKADSLVLNTRFLLNEAAFHGIQINQISGKLNYAADKAMMETVLKIDSTKRVSISAAVPLQLSADSMKMKICQREPINGRVIFQEISLDLLKKMGLTEPVDGIFEGELKLSGTVESPAVNGKFALQDATFSDYRFINFNGAMHYSNNLLSMNALVVPQDSGRLEAEAVIPLHFFPDSLKLSLNNKDSIRGKLTIDQVTLALLQEMNPAWQITGHIGGEINLNGTIESPAPEGTIQLQDASVLMRGYGIDYREIDLNIHLQRKKIAIENLLVRSRDGNMTGNGQIDFSKDLFSGEVRQSDLSLKFNRFQPFSHKQFNMELDGSATMGGKKGEVFYKGEITIPRSEIYIPAVMRMLGHMTALEIPEPLLVRELKKNAERKDTMLLSPVTSPTGNDSLPGYLDDFKGNLRLHIPRNTWIKNKDLYVEISGDLELIKNRAYFELFGTVDVVRGQYDLLGKTFKIAEGSVSFQGGKEMMPYLNIEALYTFRNPQRIEKQLTLDLSGPAESPQVQFNLDGNSISEGDALSYILFGKGINELTISEQDNIAGQKQGSLAATAAASILSAQLSNFLNEQLSVDYLEVKSDKGFDNATVVVGKYITNDLFVSYQQRFGETREKDMAKYEVKMEYELFPFLFFELNNSSRESGFDVIFKFDAK